MEHFPDELLWNKPAGCAAPAFHLLHIPGVLDRLLCYAEGKNLTEIYSEDIARQYWEDDKKVICIETSEIFNSIRDAEIKYNLKPAIVLVRPM